MSVMLWLSNLVRFLVRNQEYSQRGILLAVSSMSLMLAVRQQTLPIVIALFIGLTKACQWRDHMRDGNQFQPALLEGRSNLEKRPLASFKAKNGWGLKVI